MRLERLEIGRLPGIPKGFTLSELGAGLNVVLGPNASGKTSICRAIRGLLWPAREALEAASIGGRFDAEGVSWEARREGPRVTWRREGEPSEAPPIPEQRLAHCYLLGVEELLALANDEDELAGRILTEMAGGFDVPGLLDELVKQKPRGRSEGERVRKTRGELARVRREQEDLARREQELDDLRADLAEAGEAAIEAAALEQARRLEAARRAREEAQQGLREFPAEMERLAGNEPQRLDGLRKEQEAQRQRLREQQSKARRAREAIEAAALAEGAVDRSRLDALEQAIEELLRRENDLQTLDQRIDEAVARLDRARQALAGRDWSGEMALDGDAVSEAEACLVELQALRAERSRLEAELEARTADEPQTDPDALRAATDELTRWLEAGTAPEGAQDSGPAIWMVLASALLAVGGAAALGWTLHWTAALAALPALALAWLALRRGPAAAPPVDPRPGFVARFRETGCIEPEHWNRDSVAVHLEKLEEERAAALAARAHAQERQRAESELERLRPREEKNARRRERLASDCGLAPSIAGLDLVGMAHRIRDHGQAEQDHDDALRARRRADERSGELGAEISAFLEAHGESPDGDGSRNLRAALVRLRHRSATVLGETRALQESEQACAQLGDALEAKAEEERALFREAALTPDDEAELRRRCELLATYRTARQDLARKEAVEQNEAKSLKGHEELAALDTEELQRRAADARQRAGGVQDLTQRIAGIVAELAQARGGARLGDAAAAHDEALRCAADAREQALEIAAGCFLLEDVTREHLREGSPVVLTRAQDWFQRFTGHAWSLGVEGGGLDGAAPRFHARDHSAGEHRALAQLSSGTRMQLLIAVRLAFATEAEPAGPIPLLLDEALTTSDPERYSAVVGCLKVLAADDQRQIIYLTSQPWDAAQWGTEGVDGAGSAALKRIDLAEVRRLATGATAPAELHLPPAREIPDPTGMTPEHFGAAIGARRFDPFEEAGALHLFHLLRDDLVLVTRLLRQGYEHCGQVQALLESDAAATLLDATQAETLNARIDVVDAFLESWRIGRGAPLDRDRLSQAGVPDSFIDRIAELADELHGDAAALLAAIEDRVDPRVKRFQRKTLTKLRENLERAGHLDTRPVLEPCELKSRVLGAAAAAIEAGRLRAEQVGRLVDELSELAAREHGTAATP